MSRRVRVKVPATSANLGPGFDVLGLAVGLHDTVEAQVAADGCTVSVEGVGASEVPRDESHLVVRAMRAAFEELNERLPGLAVSCVNNIPHGRGLGSSAAAVVGGILAARALVDDGPSRMDDAAALALAVRLEGHPDNVAPCLLGGLTIAWTDAGSARATRLEVHRDIAPMVCVPAESLSTEAARKLLPETVPHAHAVQNAARAALLVEALTRRPDLLFEATVDLLHQPYREPVLAESSALMAELRSRRLPAVISGAGPAVLVLATAAESDRVKAPAGWNVHLFDVDREGARVAVV